MAGQTKRLRAFLWGPLIGLATVLSGCEKIGDPFEAIGARPPAPDEFKVLPRKPLVLPASARLPEPSLGAPSPLEIDPGRDAIDALLLTTAPAADAPVPADADGEPARGDASVAAPAPAATGLSGGEAVLLRSANAAAASPEIRVQLEQDRLAREAAEAEGPYEPPTIIELFTGRKDDGIEDPEAVLEPIAESQRLQRGGLRAPSDPNAEAIEPDQPDDSPAGFFYSDSTGNRPENKISDTMEKTSE